MRKLRNYSEKEFVAINEFVAKSSPMSSHYNSKNFIESWLFNKKRKIIACLLSKEGIDSVVDFGCGDGGLAEALEHSGLKYKGIDISKTQISLAKKRLKNRLFSFVVGDASKTGFKAGNFDAAVCTDVIEHVRNPLAVFNELKRVVKPGGRIIISVPNEKLWGIARMLLLRFPLHSPDHINVIFPKDIKQNFKNIESAIHLPFNTTFNSSLMTIFIIKN